MTDIHVWAVRWGVPAQCLTELFAVMGAVQTDPAPTTATGEAAVQQAVRLEATRRGSRLWRNNTGAYQDETGRFVRYGLCNESPAVNAVCKSSDLIGITPVTCGCGRRWGVFTAYEIKAGGWKFRQSDKRAVAQLNYLQLVVSLGGIGKFITRVEDL